MSNHILVVVDDDVTRNTLVGYFDKEGYRVSQASDAAGLRAIFTQHHVDILILDINVSDEDGLLLIRELRGESTAGIILLTGRVDSIDRIIGLEMGADDCITHPIALRELLARVKNLLWRVSLMAGDMVSESVLPPGTVSFGDWRFDIARRALFYDDKPVRLTKAEYELLVALTSCPNQVLSREKILNLLSHRVDMPNDRTIDVLIRRLRAKIEFDPKNPQIFVTVHGEGYMFAGD
ncbi:two-component system response regulator TorR [Vibrio sp. H11]|uniref:two-component system response regulator TorR n=1 Tax=Vibrio sp. H11 TaxID=2565928 RepID=UPI0010A5E10E|nr:two-component system response regulator TorR [Vibrio sp. H11]